MNLLNAEQVCQQLQIKKSYLYHLTHHNKIPFLKIGNHLRFDQADINSWLEYQKNGNGGDDDGDLQQGAHRRCSEPLNGAGRCANQNTELYCSGYVWQ